MNQVYTHCLDCDEDCPKDCFRIQLEEDLMRLSKIESKFSGIPVLRHISYAHLRGSNECDIE